MNRTAMEGGRTRVAGMGARRVILGDLSPAATFIAATTASRSTWRHSAEPPANFLRRLKREIGWMYETFHTDGKTKGRINYTVWSEVFSCPECAGEIVFLDEALDKETKRVRTEFPCPTCRASLSKTRLERLYISRYDSEIGRTIRAPKHIPVLVNYNIGKSRYEKNIDDQDIATLLRIEELNLPSELPSTELPYMHMTHERAHMDLAGVTHLHHFFLPRAAHALAAMWHRAVECEDHRLRNMLLFFVEQAIWSIHY